MTESSRAPRPGCPARPTDPDGLGAAAWRAWIDHLDSCDPCRDAWLEEDPSRCFAWLPDDPVPDTVLEDVSRAVSRAVDAEESSRARPARPFVATVAAGALAASLTAGVFLARPAVPSGGGGVGQGTRTRADVAIRGETGGVRVVDLTVGDRQVVMIYDERMPL